MELSGIIIFVKILSVLLSIGFLGGIIASAMSAIKLKNNNILRRDSHFNINKESQSLYKKRWMDIVQQFKSSDPIFWRVAILDADAMLEDMITEMGYTGSTFGEKLKHMQREGVTWCDAAWDVHLLRNKLAHEGSRYPLNDRESYRAYRIYENLLESNGYLA
jgi:hypothetical protein